MGITIGPVDWWLESPDTLTALVASCPVGTILPDKSALICKTGGGTAWIVAPVSTQVCSTWNGTTTQLVGNKCCVCDWPTLCSRMISCGFNPSDWFVPSCSQLQNPGYLCRSRWDTIPNLCSCTYWGSTETDSTNAPIVNFTNSATHAGTPKNNVYNIRAFRCVNY
jgi:hypothetical protein